MALSLTLTRSLSRSSWLLILALDSSLSRFASVKYCLENIKLISTPLSFVDITIAMGFRLIKIPLRKDGLGELLLDNFFLETKD